MRLIQRIRRRLADWRRERRICDLRACALIEAEAGRYDMAEEAAAVMRAEIRLRSPEQLQRLARPGKARG